MKYFSTFSGIGGFELGIGDRAECIGYSEIDKYAIEIYSHHFPNHKNYGDIKKIEAYRLPDFDIFVGGFPCQAFSIAGKRHGFADTRGTLFFDIMRIIGSKRPAIIVLENVKGLLSHNKGKTLSVILEKISGLGYSVEWVVLNSKFFGVPQNRERIFIIGYLGEEPRREILPFGKSDKAPTEKGKKSVNCIDANYYKGVDNHGQRTVVYDPQMIRLNPGEQPQGNRVYSTQGITPTLSANGGGHQENSAVMDNMSPTLTAQGDVPALINRQMKEPEIKKPIPKFDDSQTRFDEDGNFKVSRSISFRPRENNIINKNNISYSLDSGVHVGVIETEIKKIVKSTQGNTIYSADGIFPTLSSGQHGWANGYIEDDKAKPTMLGNANALTGVTKDNLILSKEEVRRLTPLECERLQGFPDNWTKINDISDTQRYKTLGNAVTVNVVDAIFGRLLY